MKRIYRTTIYLCVLLVGMLTTSCEREFDHDADFKLNEPAKYSVIIRFFSLKYSSLITGRLPVV